MDSRETGICLHLTSLPGPYGIGELGRHARDFVDRLVTMGVTTWQILPVGPTAYGNSPYQPLSAFAGNPLLLDLETLVRQGLARSSELAPLRSLSQSAVDYGALIPKKMRLLKQVARRFSSVATNTARGNFETYLQHHDERWLHEYALYRVLKARHDQLPWHEWDPEYSSRNSSALRQFQNQHRDDINAVKTLQYLFYQQWCDLKSYASDKGIALFGDVPIYIALDSAEAWSCPELLQLNETRMPTHVAGVPPDYFSSDGQRWGNPLYDWDTHAKQNYRWWQERLGWATELHDLIRLDHFRGFESYWAIPASASTAREGKWCIGPGDRLFEQLKADLGKLPIIAEDLGIITPAVEELRRRCGFPGMKVLQFLIEDEAFDPATIPADTVCYTGTHDNDTIRGWFHGSAGESLTSRQLDHRQHRARVATHSPNERIHEGLIKLALSTPSQLVVIPLQDMMGLDSRARMNVPGTTFGNWQWRLEPDSLTDHHVESMALWIDDAGRSRRTVSP